MYVSVEKVCHKTGSHRDLISQNVNDFYILSHVLLILFKFAEIWSFLQIGENVMIILFLRTKYYTFFRNVFIISFYYIVFITLLYYVILVWWT